MYINSSCCIDSSTIDGDVKCDVSISSTFDEQHYYRAKTRRSFSFFFSFYNILTMNRSAPDFNLSHPGSTPHAMGVFPSRRSTVMGVRGMVSSSQPLASQAGIAILNQGGNAADAAVAVAAALNVTEPCSNGIGGDSFCLYWDAAKKEVKGINASGRSPAKMTLEALEKDGLSSKKNGGMIPSHNVHGVTVPGAAANWVDTVDRFGSGKLKLAQILEPAIRLAEDGFPVHEIVAAAWDKSEEAIRNASPNGNEMLLNGKAPKAGQVMKMPYLAQTFRELAEKGRNGFYKGRIAEAIVECLKAKGGLMEMDDLAHHGEVGSEDIIPISYEYGATKADGGDGVTLHECPPNGQGLVALIALGVLDAMHRAGKLPDPNTMNHNSSAYLHALIEALRFGFADAKKYVTDAAHGGSSRIESILSRQYLDERAKIFNPDHTVPIQHGNPDCDSGTVYFSVTDEHGNACSFIQSNFEGFGSCIIPKHCGFTLQNRGRNFSLEKDHINCVAPRKRPLHTILPAMATKNGPQGRELFMSYGCMGGEMQAQGQVQILLNILRGYTPQSAIDAPRFCIGAGMADQGDTMSGVFFEEGIDEKVVEELKKMGHDTEIVPTWEKRGQFGRAQIIMEIDGGSGRRVWAAGCDPRSDGTAIAQV
jgi:gamma-glutamyltranspeptidase/glutathione hydrolase